MRRIFPLLFLLLAGCAATPVAPPVADPLLAWSEHRRQLDRVNDWQLGGRIAIRTEDEGWQAAIDWRQQGEGYTIQLTGPLGQGSLRLQGDGRLVTLSSGDEVLVDEDAEALLHRQMGWRVPVTALRYWALGLPAPGAAEQELNPQGLLGRLRQADWNIEFRDYTRRGGLLLPGRLFISNHNAQVRLVVDRWEPL
jgi:outer membrane lipoprotein LolB